MTTEEERMDATKPRDTYVEMLIGKVREDRYPSGQLMDRIEASFSQPEQVLEYLEVLMEKVDDSRYPSGQLLDRIERLSGMLARR
jgi:hypothetical protein